METVLITPAEKETQTDSPLVRQSTKLTWLKKRSILSSNGDGPHTVFVNPQTDKDVQSHIEEMEEGWRYVEKVNEKGQVKYERVPLTAYELLHPQEDYIIVHKSAHDSNTERISTSTKMHLTNVPNVRVFGDLRTELNLSGVPPVSPDISIVFGVSKERIWSTFDCQKEGVHPSVVFEVTSPKTRANDFTEKRDYYRRAGIPYYVILDIEYGWDGSDETATYHLHLFELKGGQYEEKQPTTEGRYWLPPLKMWVGIGDGGILFYDEHGALLPTAEELKQMLNATEQKLDDALDHADEQERIAQEEAARATEQECIAQQARILAQEADARAAEQERIAQLEAARAAEQERIAQQERVLAQEADARAAEQKRIAQQEAARAAEQERIAQQERILAQEADARAAEQKRIAQQERMFVQVADARAAEQERIAQAALEAQLATEAKVAELLAQMAEFQVKSE